MFLPSAIEIGAKSLLCGLYKYSGAASIYERLACSHDRTRMVILLFHCVTDDIPENGLTVGTGRFRRICHMLQRQYRVAPLGEIVRLARAGNPLPPRTLAITFDDCYRNNLDAAQILAEHRLPACFFIPTAYVGTDHVFPWDAQLPRRLPNMSWDDVSALARLGFEIGSHTMTHPNLGRSSRADAQREIIESRRVLQERTGQPVRWFAYPFGGQENFREEFLPLVVEAGYEACFSGHGGFIPRNHQSLMLPREAVPYFHSVTNLELYLCGALNWFYAWKKSEKGNHRHASSRY